MSPYGVTRPRWVKLNDGARNPTKSSYWCNVLSTLYTSCDQTDYIGVWQKYPTKNSVMFVLYMQKLNGLKIIHGPRHNHRNWWLILPANTWYDMYSITHLHVHCIWLCVYIYMYDKWWETLATQQRYVYIEFVACSIPIQGRKLSVKLTPVVCDDDHSEQVNWRL